MLEDVSQYLYHRSQPDGLLLWPGHLTELPQLHQAAHDLAQLHPRPLRPVQVGQIPAVILGFRKSRQTNNTLNCADRRQVCRHVILSTCCWGYLWRLTCRGRADSKSDSSPQIASLPAQRCQKKKGRCVLVSSKPPLANLLEMNMKCLRFDKKCWQTYFTKFGDFREDLFGCVVLVEFRDILLSN